MIVATLDRSFCLVNGIRRPNIAADSALASGEFVSKIHKKLIDFKN